VWIYVHMFSNLNQSPTTKANQLACMAGNETLHCTEHVCDVASRLVN
jgi:hypothetical protein